MQIPVFISGYDDRRRIHGGSMSEQRFEYYAFISYNRHDRHYAEKLQNQLQRYRLPSAFVTEHPGHPKHISPVFLDQTDLLAHEGPLALSLQAQLEASNFLIVLCSPNSALSPWVNAEVDYFISRGRKDRIVPIILEGTPHAQDPAQECYPPALASLPAEEELLGISVADYGWRGAFLRVLATILHLKMDTVIKRDASWRRRKRILVAGIALTAAAGVFALVWHNTPHTSYFRNIVTRWAAPEGISPVSSAERVSLSASWKLTTLRGQVIQAEYVNSAGQLARDVTMLSSEPPMVRVVYDSDGKVSRKEYYDLNRRPLYTLQYSGNLRIADFVSSDSGNAVALASDSVSVSALMTSRPAWRPDGSTSGTTAAVTAAPRSPTLPAYGESVLNTTKQAACFVSGTRAVTGTSSHLPEDMPD